MKPLDVDVTGQMGLYAIARLTKRAERWTAKKLRGEQTVHHGCIMVEGGDRIMAIVAAMVAAGLRVEVNGAHMKGFKVAS